MTRRTRQILTDGQPRPAPDVSADALGSVERSILLAWEEERRGHPEESDADTAARVVADPSLYPWRLVDAAVVRLDCPECGSGLAEGPVGCAACDLAHGFRFAGREPDGPGLPPGNEHAIRVSTAVLRSPDRYPRWAVDANRVHLPLFLAGQMPSRREQQAMLRASERGVQVDTAGVSTFAELAARALDACAAGSGAHTLVPRGRGVGLPSPRALGLARRRNEESPGRGAAR